MIPFWLIILVFAVMLALTASNYYWIPSKKQESAGDWWMPQAYQMIGGQISRIDVRGCMAEVEIEMNRGRVFKLERTLDPYGFVIWEARCRSDIEGDDFKVIVARCSWNKERARWEERV
jgi:hypothetical protein